MKWYADYLSIYDKPFTQAPQAVINQVKDKIRQLATHAPLVSVVAIAHNEEKDRKSTRLNSSHEFVSRMPSSA